jgi:hypothetical protein
MIAICIFDTFEHVRLKLFYNGDLLLRKDIFDCLQRGLGIEMTYRVTGLPFERRDMRTSVRTIARCVVRSH